MKSQQIGLGITLVVLAASSVGLLVTDGPGAAWPPALGAVIGGVLLYRLVKPPQPPTRWTKQRVIVSALAIGPTAAAMVAVLVWVVAVVPHWPTRVLALVGIAFVSAMLLWFVRIACQQDQAARAFTQGTPTE